MILRRLLLSLLALGLTAGQNTDIKFLVVVPAVMPSPSNQTLCVYMESIQAQITIHVSLKIKDNTIILTSQTYQGEGQMKCDPFQVPYPGDLEEIATIIVEVQNGDSVLLETKSVLIRPLRKGMFVQTDRPIYQPGETMIIKAVPFKEDLIASNEKFTSVILQDSNGNIIKQWMDVEPISGIMELTFNLSPNIALGDFTFTVQKNDIIEYVTVKVDKYVMPKFKLTIDSPKEITIVQSTFPLNMCGKYTYGKPVRGHITGKICRLATINGGKEDICTPIDGETNVRGCYVMNINTDNFQLKSFGYDNYIDVEASLEEDGTGVEKKDQLSIYITTVMAKVQFTEPRSTFKTGLVYRGQMTLMGADGQSMPDEDIALYVNGIRTDDIYTTNENGVAGFSLDTATWENKQVDLRGQYIPSQPLTDSDEVNPSYDDGYAVLIPFYSKGKSQLKIRNEPFVLPCNEKVNLWADFALDPSEISKASIHFCYMVIANGQIIHDSGMSQKLAPDSGLKGFFPFLVDITSQMFPAATFIVYAVLSNGDLLADSVQIPVSSCFPNTISLQFSEQQSLPGSMLSLHITAYPNSLCNVRAVDKSIELLKSEDNHPEDTVNELRKNWDIHGYPIELQSEESQECPPGSHPIFTDISTDIFKLFEDPAMKVLTNFIIKKPLACKITVPPVDEGRVMVAAAIISEDIPLAGPNLLVAPAPAQVRKEFPSTWLMNSVLTGPTGQLDYALKTPDTITQWNVDAFCIASIGLGFSPRANLQVFKPLLLEIILPYSVKQGETMNVKAIVLNFMKQCIKVQTTLYESEDFQQEPCADCSYTACLCNDPTYTFTWAVKPSKMGTIDITIGTEALDTTDLCDGQTPIVPGKGQSDIVQRRLIVEPNGLPVENTRSLLLCAFDAPEIIPVDVPEDVVLGSQTAEVTVTGDIMGKPLSNLDNLLRLPQGCGEQNMMLLAPVIATIQYYSLTGQLTDEIVEKANGFMEAGYQNQLNYKHNDGSYSAFGNSDPSGSTWLTGFVARNLHLAKYFIYIEDKHIYDALNWLKGLQQEDGCFPVVGTVIHPELQGGADSLTSLTAYVTATFRIIDDPQYDDVIINAKKCLEKCTEPESTTYTKAQCAYTYTLTGDSEKRAQLLEQLNEVAIEKDDKKHWSKNPDSLLNNPESADVEMTAYVIQALLTSDSPSSADLGAAVPAVHWLTSKQNANGGFVTTTDTVVAVLALSTYGSHTFTYGSSPIITVTNENGFSSAVSVDPEKPMDVQHVQLPDIPAEYILEASGSGCAYVQVTERYNVLEPKPEGIFALSVNTECSSNPVPAFTIGITASYNNNNEDSNMAILMVKMVSGYVPVQESVDRLLANELVKKTETKQSEVVIYLEKVGPDPMELSFQVEQQSQVTDLKSAQMTLMDYYKPTRRIDVNYEAPCN